MEDIPFSLRLSESMHIDTDYDAHIQSNTVELNDADSNSVSGATVANTAMRCFTFPLRVLFKYTCPPAAEGID